MGNNNNKSRIVEPQGAVIIWNYDSRLNTAKSGSPPDERSTNNAQKLDEVIILTASLKSISTSKTKSRPEGQFELRLAPTFNWVTRITPGSWCSLIMTRDEPTLPLSPSGPLKATSTRDKFFGKIESVRLNVTVDANGTRNTEYIATGTDWGDAFNQMVYVDPIVASNITDKLGSVGGANFLFYSNLVHSYQANPEGSLPTSGGVVKSILRLWGSPIKELTDGLYNTTGILGAVEKTYEMPKEVMLYWGFSSKSSSTEQKPENIGGIPTTTVADLIDIKEGILTGPDKYSGDIKEAYGFPEPSSILGSNPVWGLIVANANTTLYECVTDLSWDNKLQAQMTLFRRVKPFVNRIDFSGNDDVKELISPFKYIKTYDIPIEDIITINLGTNVKDRFNFIELLTNSNLMTQYPDQFKRAGKLTGQIYDSASISRDGFKPLIDRNIKYLPYTSGKIDPAATSLWKFILKEWFFNTHVMLNGSLNMVGQNEYIRVGDNIRIDAGILGEDNMNKAQVVSPGVVSYLLCHVESVAHSFTVDPNNGSRSFKTTISFVRGIIVDKNGNIAENNNIAIDSDATAQTAKERQKNYNNLGRSTSKDPDIRKLKGR